MICHSVLGIIKYTMRLRVIKALYNEDAYDFIWQWIADRKTITNISNNFDEVSKEENINGVLGASRINKILFTIKNYEW